MKLEPFWSLVRQSYPQFSSYDLTTIRLVTQGWDSLVLDVNDDYIFRFPRREATTQQFEKEVRLLPELMKRLSVPVPDLKYIQLNPQEPAKSFIGYPKLQGEPLTRETARSDQILEQLGTFLSELHRFPIQQAVHLNVPAADPKDWRQNHVDFYNWVRTYSFPRMKTSEIAHFSGLWEDFLEDDSNFDFQPVLIHGDLVSEHILCDPQDDSLSGTIDWGDARIGDPALDFVGLNITGGEEVVERILSFYQTSSMSTFWRRINFYTAIIPFYKIQYGFIVNQKQHIVLGLQQIQENMPGFKQNPESGR